MRYVLDAYNYFAVIFGSVFAEKMVLNHYRLARNAINNWRNNCWRFQSRQKDFYL